MENLTSFDDIENLFDKIQNIKNINQLEKIKSIIIKYNPGIKLTNNKNGVFLRFDNLKDETYKKLNVFIKKVTLNNSMRRLSETSVCNSESERDTTKISEIKFSNKEKNIIKRCNYDKQCENNDCVFIKKKN